MNRLADRIKKLERSRGNGYVATRFLNGSSETTAADYKRLKEQTLDEMIAAGEITEEQRNKVFFIRFLAADEVDRSGNGPPIPLPKVRRRDDIQQVLGIGNRRARKCRN